MTKQLTSYYLRKLKELNCINLNYLNKLENDHLIFCLYLVHSLFNFAYLFLNSIK